MAEIDHMNILDISKEANRYKLTISQYSYLLAHVVYDKKIKIRLEEMVVLMDKGYIVNDEVTDKAYTTIKRKLDRQAKEVRTVILTEETSALLNCIAKKFWKNYSREFDLLKNYFSVDRIPYVYLFFQLFPTSDRNKNNEWNKEFEVVWTNATLRRMSKGTAAKLNNIMDKYDYGLFIFGTFNYIRETRNEESGKYYITTMEKYLTNLWRDNYDKMVYKNNSKDFNGVIDRHKLTSNIVINGENTRSNRKQSRLTGSEFLSKLK